jgi:ADP-ribose pyrophosphatase YjhB (NUDIX family)
MWTLKGDAQMLCQIRFCQGLLRGADMSGRSYTPDSGKPFKLSRTGLELFRDCPRCFYLHKRLGIGRPRGFPFNINSAVDSLLKREFDIYREQAKPHPLMTAAGVDAVPFSHPDLAKWRHNFTGIRHQHKASGLLLYGAVDDLWESADGELIVVDYKATSKKDEITTLDQEWHGVYKRQLEIYQWLLRRNGFRVSSRAWWVYANGDASAERFDQTLRFRMTLIPYDGDDSWVEGHVLRAKACLSAHAPPPPADDCELCRYAREAGAYASLAQASAARESRPVSAGLLLFRGQGESLEVLLVRAKGAVPWGIPKGVPRDGESLIDAARRETKEETGVVGPDSLVDLGNVCSRGNRKTVHCFAGSVDSYVEPVCASDEIDRAEFLPLAGCGQSRLHML